MRKTMVFGAGAAISILAAMPGIAIAQSEIDRAQAQESEEENPVICRRVAAPTGSRIGARRVCRTQSQWEAERQAARETLNNPSLRHRTVGE